MIEIRHARFGDMTAQKRIWRERFGDSWEYIRYYYRHRYREEETLLLLENGEIAAMLALMPMELISPAGDVVPTLYLYALAAASRVEGRGLGTALLEEAKNCAARLGIDNILLVPAEPGLHRYFGKRGYEEKFAYRQLCFNSLNSRREPQGTLSSAEPEEYDALRETLLAGRLHVRCGPEGAEYQKGLSRRSGADLYILQIGNCRGCAAAERAPGRLVALKELLLPDELLEEGVLLIAKALPASGYRVRLPEDSGKEHDGRSIEFGMIWRCFPEDEKWGKFTGTGYLGFGFD